MGGNSQVGERERRGNLSCIGRSPRGGKGRRRRYGGRRVLDRSRDAPTSSSLVSRRRRRRAETGDRDAKIPKENRVRRKRGGHRPNGGDIRERRAGNFGAQKEGRSAAERAEASDPYRVNQ